MEKELLLDSSDCLVTAYEELEHFRQQGHFIITTKLGLWWGIQEVIPQGFFDNRVDAILKCWIGSGDSILRIYKKPDDNQNYYLECTHHDGTNHFVITEISSEKYDKIVNGELGKKITVSDFKKFCNVKED